MKDEKGFYLSRNQILIITGVEEIRKEQAQRDAEQIFDHVVVNENDMPNAKECVSGVVSDQTAGDDVSNSNPLLEDFLVEFDVSKTLTSSSKPIDYEIRLQNEIEQYINTPTNANISEGLQNAPTIRKLYMKYNSIRSTEAICERMFSYAGE